MAKELPYFKFEPGEWENGNIQICSREDKGLFIDLCSMYWARLGDLPLKLAIRKLCDGNATAFDSLMREQIFEVNDGMVCIHFLNEQLLEFENISNQNSKNAFDGWRKRRSDKHLSGRNASASNPQSEKDAIREDKRREDKMRREKKKEEKKREDINTPADKSAGIVEAEEGLFTACMDIYDLWFKKMFSTGAKIDGTQGKALKSIIDYLKSQVHEKNPESIKNAWQYIFENWGALDDFTQSRTRLTDINSNLQNIIVQIKNKKNGKTKRKGEPDIADAEAEADRILAEYERKQNRTSD